MPLAYTRRVVAYRQATQTNGQLLYTNTSPDVVILRDLVVMNLHTATQLIGIFIPGAGGALWVYRSNLIQPNETFHLELRQQLVAGEQLQLQTGAGGATVLITGYFLSQ